MPWIPASTADAISSARGCRVVTSAATSVASNTETVLSFGSEADDTDSFHDTATNPSRITIPSGLAGVYLIVGQVRFAANGTGQRYCRLHINGSGNDYGDTNNAVSTVGSHVHYTGHKRLAVGDYLELAGWQSSGGALDANGYFSAYLIGS